MGNIEELVASLSRDAVAVKPAPHPFMLSLGWLAAATVYLAVALWFSGVRPDLMQKLHQPWFVIELAFLGLIFVATSLSAALLAFPDLHQMRKIAWAPALLFVLFAVFMFFSWRADMPPAPQPVHSLECTFSILAVSLLPAAWTFLSMRRFASTHHRWAGYVALLSAFSIGALWLRLYELNDSVGHVVEWHYLPMLLLGLVGMRLGRALLKW